MEVTFAKINFKKRDKDRENEHRNATDDLEVTVIYREVQPFQSDNRNELKTVGGSKAADCDNWTENKVPPEKSELNVMTSWVMWLLLILCAVLLISTLTVGALYAMTPKHFQQRSDETEKNLTDQLKNLTGEKEELEQKLAETHEGLQNLTREHKQLKQTFSETNITFTDQLQNLSRNNEKCNQVVKEKEQSYNNLASEKEELQKFIDQKCKIQSTVCCADNQLYHSFKCYYLSAETKTWTDSRNNCKSKGGDLIIIKTEEVKSFLSKPRGGTSYWIGLTDSETEGDWRWVDDTLFKKTAMSWTGNEPDNWKGENESGEDCAVWKSDQLMDNRCNEEKNYICETKASFKNNH